MPAGQVNFEFISSNASSREEHDKFRRLARSHASKVVRRNKKDEAKKNKQLSKKSAGKQKTATREQVVRTISSSTEEVVEDEGIGSSESSPDGDQPPIVEEVRRSGAAVAKAMSVYPSPARTLSPTFGALPGSTIDADDFYAATTLPLAEVASFWFNQIWPNTVSEEGAQVWWGAFCEHPVIYHGMLFRYVVHRESVGLPLPEAAHREVLPHKIKAIQLINKMLEDLQGFNIELAICAIICMRHEQAEEEPAEVEDVKLLFIPHMPALNLTTTYRPSQYVEAHTRAISSLVSRMGGLDKITFPGVAQSIESSELLSASHFRNRPSFPCPWSFDRKLLMQRGLLSFKELARSPGNGFATDIPGGLPEEALSVFLDLSCIDKVMASRRDTRLSADDFQVIMLARNVAHHRLLSLRPWSELSDGVRSDSYLATYECCRLTAILYSNAVIFPLAPGSDWYLHILGDLRRLLESCQFRNWKQDVSAMLIWVLSVAGIAAFRSKHRAFFKTLLRETLVKAGVLSWKDAREIVNRFVWSDSACGHGAAVLWDALDLECLYEYVQGIEKGAE